MANKTSPDSNTDNRAAKKLRNRSRSTELRLSPEGTASTSSNSFTSLNTSKESPKLYRIESSINIDQGLSDDRKRASSLQNLTEFETKSMIPNKISKKCASSEDILKPGDVAVATPHRSKSEYQNTSLHLSPQRRCGEATQMECNEKESNEQLSRNSMKRRSSTGLPQGACLSESVKTKIAGRLRAVSVSSYEVKLHSMDKKKVGVVFQCLNLW